MGEIIERKSESGPPKFYVRYMDTDGRRKMRAAPPGEKPESVRERRKAAERFLAGIETRMANGKVGIVEPTEEEKARRTITVRELTARFLTDYSPPRLKDVEEYRLQARAVFKVRILPPIGDKAAADVTAADVEKLRDGMTADHYAAGSVNLTLSAISRLYTWGRKVGLIDCQSPTTGCDRPARVSTVDYYDAAEVGNLLAEAERQADHYPPGLYPMVATAVYGGLRKGELFGLRWRDLDLDARRLTVARSYTLAPKSGKVRHLRLHPELARILRTWRDRCPKTDDGLVFPLLDRGKLRMGERKDHAAIGDLILTAGCHLPADGKPWHLLRHTFASHFMMRGGNILTLQKLLGHASLNMTVIYAHLAPDFVDTEICRLDFARPVAAGLTDLGAVRREREMAGEGAAG